VDGGFRSLIANIRRQAAKSAKVRKEDNSFTGCAGRTIERQAKT